jgi:hypothetical protein
MKRKVKISLVILFILVSFLLFTFYKDYSKKKEDNSFNLGISKDFIEKFKWKQSSYTHDSVTFTGNNENSIIQIKVLKDINLEKANTYISDKMFMINSLFRGVSSPYPGALSNRIECPEEFKPVKLTNKHFDYYIVYASSRFTYGVCSWDLIKYQSIIYFLHCNEEESLYYIKLFISTDKEISDYEKMLTSLKCLE